MSSSTPQFAKYKLVQVKKTDDANIKNADQNVQVNKNADQNVLSWLKDGLPLNLQKKGVDAYNAIKNEIEVDDEGMVTYKVTTFGI